VLTINDGAGDVCDEAVATTLRLYKIYDFEPILKIRQIYHPCFFLPEQIGITLEQKLIAKILLLKAIQD
jgi:hypothetical protein